MFTPTDRRALRSVAAQFFVNGAVFASFIPRMPEIRDRVGITVTEVGIILSIASVAAFGSNAVVGRLIERLGSRVVLLAGGVMLSSGLVVIGVAERVEVLVIGLLMMTTFDVMVDVAMNLQGSWLSARRHRPVMNRLHGAWSVGTLVGGLGAAQMAALGVSVTAHLIGAAVVLAGVLVYVGTGLLRADEHSVDQAASTRRRTMTGFGLLALVGFAAVVIESTAMDWAAFRFTDDFGSSAAFGALGYAAMAGGMTTGRLAGDHLLHRLGSTRLLRAALGAAGLGLTLATLVPSPPVTYVGLLLTGLGGSTMLPQLYDRAAKWPGRPGAGLGALTAGVRAAVLLSPLVIGGLAGIGLSIGSAMALFTLPAVVLFWYGHRAIDRHH